jgi:hypothetical protein
MLLTPEPEGLRDARARYQDDLAAAEEHYAVSLRSLGRDPSSHSHSARLHRARAARIRRGVE